MDTVTHIVLGGCIGEALLGKKLGKKALLVGAVAQSIPDVDFITYLWKSPADALLAHRGFTHSILFILLISPVLAFLARRLYGKYEITFRKWIYFFCIQLLVHIFIDAFNVYGTGWFEPFSHYRISFNTIYVVDPLFSIWPFIAFVVLSALPLSHVARTFWWRFGVLLSGLYLGYCIVNKASIDDSVKRIADERHIQYSQSLVTPSPFNNWLWYVVLKKDSGFLVGYRSLFDQHDSIDFHYFARNDSLLQPFIKSEAVHELTRFSKGFYTAEKWGESLVFNDLRFGQVVGWYDPKENFVFHFFLQRGGHNLMAVQRGRFSGWNWWVFKSLLARIEGK
jgi:inner membrane protein